MLIARLAPLVVLLSSLPWPAAASPASPRCRTSIAELQAKRRVLARPPAPHEAHAGPLMLRDAFGDFASPVVSEHFALKTGPDRPLSAAEAQTILMHLERAWADEVGRMKLPAPAGDGVYYLNAYIGNSGGGAPDISFASAYVSMDPELLPYITIHPMLIGAPELAQVLAHEFFHALQTTMGVYLNEDVGWYWEATADWAAHQVYPSWAPDNVGAYLSLPEVSLDFMDYPDTGKLIEYHHYGAALFPLFLTDHVADWTLIRDSWSEASDDDPLVTLDGLLMQREKPGVNALLPGYAARNAMFDYAEGERYRDQLELVMRHAGATDGIALHLTGTGTTGFVDAPTDSLPSARGYNVVQLLQPAAGTLRVELQGKPGTGDHSGGFAAVLGRRDASGVSYTTVPYDEASKTGKLNVLDAGSATELTLAISALPMTPGPRETFPYAVRFEITAPDPVTTSSQEGGCSLVATHAAATPRLLVSALLLALGYALARRQRRGA